MADFSTPFSSASANNWRYLTNDEKQNGLACGPLERQMLNNLFRALQAEIAAVITYGSVAFTDSDDTLLRQAITNMIDAATGGSGDFVLMAQARARLPIYPEVTSASDYRITVTTPSVGTVRVPASATFLHRGIYEVTTSQEDFATTASKTYHLRWDPTNGFDLYDLADSVTYNPAVLAETDASFDSTYDDMLVARVVTNGSNVATITNLSNASVLAASLVQSGTDWFYSGLNHSSSKFAYTYNWARRPINKALTYLTMGANTYLDKMDIDRCILDYALTKSGFDAGAFWADLALPEIPVTRYDCKFRYMFDEATHMKMELSIRT